MKTHMPDRPRSNYFKDSDKFIKIINIFPVRTAAHNKARVEWIGSDGKTFAQMWKKDSFYRKCILRKSYAGNGSMIDQDIRYDITRGFIIKL
tara:strand:- start:68 stop:343 length:276 start_codon:yes stop_codon:yes gene_type:complete